MKFEQKIITIERHILENQSRHPEATGALTGILQHIALAAKLITRQTTRAGLADVLGSAGEVNVQGEEVQKLDLFAHNTLYRLNDHTGYLAAMGSEEEAELLDIPKEYPRGKYILLFDPLDGSSNVDYNVSIGTIFSVLRRRSPGDGPVERSDALQPGRDIVAAGYIVYGSSTMMVYSTGHGVHGFTLDPAIGEFLLSHPNITHPATAKYYSANQGYYPRWSPGVQAFTHWLMAPENKLSLRYIGSMIADVHRTLLAGGVFFYPADRKNPAGKLRLLYEVAPMGFLIEQAGGYASTGQGPVGEIVPEDLHQRVPVFLGNRELVERAETLIAAKG
ncbi:MAG: class 1 fructose-bisphosphatase [Candidatus Competibacterales bacterium]